MGYITTQPVTALALGKSWRKGQRIGDTELPATLRDAMLIEGVIIPVSDVGLNATDAAVVLAAEGGVALAEVIGTGKDGRITKADVEQHAGEAGDD